MSDIEINQCVLPAFNLVQVVWTSAQMAFKDPTFLCCDTVICIVLGKNLSSS